MVHLIYPYDDALGITIDAAGVPISVVVQLLVTALNRYDCKVNNIIIYKDAKCLERAQLTEVVDNDLTLFYTVVGINYQFKDSMKPCVLQYNREVSALMLVSIMNKQEIIDAEMLPICFGQGQFHAPVCITSKGSGKTSFMQNYKSVIRKLPQYTENPSIFQPLLDCVYVHVDLSKDSPIFTESTSKDEVREFLMKRVGAEIRLCANNHPLCCFRSTYKLFFDELRNLKTRLLIHFDQVEVLGNVDILFEEVMRFGEYLRDTRCYYVITGQLTPVILNKYFFAQVDCVHIHLPPLQREHIIDMMRAKQMTPLKDDFVSEVLQISGGVPLAVDRCLRYACNGSDWNVVDAVQYVQEYFPTVTITNKDVRKIAICLELSDAVIAIRDDYAIDGESIFNIIFRLGIYLEKLPCSKLRVIVPGFMRDSFNYQLNDYQLDLPLIATCGDASTSLTVAFVRAWSMRAMSNSEAYWAGQGLWYIGMCIEESLCTNLGAATWFPCINSDAQSWNKNDVMKFFSQYWSAEDCVQLINGNIPNVAKVKCTCPPSDLPLLFAHMEIGVLYHSIANTNSANMFLRCSDNNCIFAFVLNSEPFDAVNKLRDEVIKCQTVDQSWTVCVVIMCTAGNNHVANGGKQFYRDYNYETDDDVKVAPVILLNEPDAQEFFGRYYNM